MKIQTINEVFTDLSMDMNYHSYGKEDYPFGVYSFGDGYEVSFAPTNTSAYTPVVLPRNFTSYVVELKYDASHRPSKLGNWAFVYNATLSAIKKHIDRYNVGILIFEGYNDAMDAVYRRMMIKFRSSGNKAYSFWKVDESVYISELLIDSLDDEYKETIIELIKINEEKDIIKINDGKEARSIRRKQKTKYVRLINRIAVDGRHIFYVLNNGDEGPNIIPMGIVKNNHGTNNTDVFVPVDGIDIYENYNGELVELEESDIDIVNKTDLMNKLYQIRSSDMTNANIIH